MNCTSIFDILEKDVGIKTRIGDVIPAEKVLVLAPHSDDEVIGCGGTILRYLEGGTEVLIIYMTDGRYGITGKDIKIRREETENAWKDYNIGLRFWDFEDSHIREDAVFKLEEVLKEYNPDVVYTTWPIDRHKDHKMTSFYLGKALEGFRENYCTVCLYEVLYPLYANRAVNITRQIDKKMELLECYKSQLSYLNLKEITEKTAYLRGAAMRFKNIKAAEAFFVCSKEDYLKLMGILF